MKIAIGNDHRGYKLKVSILKSLQQAGYKVDDMGAFTEESADYPDFAFKVGRAVASDAYNFGILVCGTGMGMSISANKVPGIRAVVCRNVFEAERSRQHNNANVLCLGADTTSLEQANEIIKAFLNTAFEGGRHQRRLDVISELEKQSH
jgi:ribose 5-phosphate isomerase B